MKKILFIAASALLLLSCSKDPDMSIYEGSYTVDNNTAITVNSHKVNLGDYENASITITMTGGENCEVALINFINGQPEVKVPATISVSDTKAAAGATFSGSVNSGDRTITVNGITADGTIASIDISEEITAEGVVGRWILESASITFSHPDLETLDLSPIIPDFTLPMSSVVDMINALIAQSIADDPSLTQSYVEFTADGYISGTALQDIPEFQNIFCYYVKPAEDIFGIYLHKSFLEQISATLDEMPELSAMLDLFGLSTLIENPQSVSVPLSYSATGTSLSLTADQSLTDPYLAMLAEPVAIIKSLISDLEYDDVIEFLYMYDLETLITADNLPAVKELVISLIDALTDGQAQYSVTVGLTSYEG
ncbi:MAG TPA: hypothetical protein IAB87_09405 [Candidatus Coprenecus merdipullorum]|nr:hypothetical protein [Candidatus Coprenecus merdipullorum]